MVAIHPCTKKVMPILFSRTFLFSVQCAHKIVGSFLFSAL